MLLPPKWWGCMSPPSCNHRHRKDARWCPRLGHRGRPRYIRATALRSHVGSVTAGAATLCGSLSTHEWRPHVRVPASSPGAVQRAASTKPGVSAMTSKVAEGRHSAWGLAGSTSSFHAAQGHWLRFLTPAPYPAPPNTRPGPSIAQDQLPSAPGQHEEGALTLTEDARGPVLGPEGAS